MKKIYLASGWFNPTQAEELTQLEQICDSKEWIDLASLFRIKENKKTQKNQSFF